MNILRALKALYLGKKVRYTEWDKGWYIYFDGTFFRDEKGNKFNLEIHEWLDLNDKGWRILRPWCIIGDYIYHNDLSKEPMKVIYATNKTAIAVNGDDYLVIKKSDRKQYQIVPPHKLEKQQ